MELDPCDESEDAKGAEAGYSTTPMGPLVRLRWPMLELDGGDFQRNDHVSRQSGFGAAACDCLDEDCFP